MKDIFRPKLFTVLKGKYSRQQFTKDVFAGIIVGIVALPLAIAFAVASGVSPEKGIITAVIAGFIISLLGGSRVQIGGPTGAFIIIVYGIVAQYGTGGLIISTFLAGILLVIFGVLKLGALLKFIPQPLIVGFTSGIALVIFSTQIKDALGLNTGELPADFIAKWGTYFKTIGTINPWAVGLTLFTIFISLFFKKITNKIPGTFVAIIVITLVVAIFKLPVTTIETAFGDIQGSFSFELPEFDLSNISVYFAPALTIAILGAIESLLSAVVSDGMIGGKHRSNTELIAQGIANIITPLFGGIPATGAIARTATNVKNGGRTPIAGIVHALTLLLIMLFLGSYAKLIPMSCLAGILIIVAYNMSEWRSFIAILRGSAFDVIILLITFFLTVLVDLSIAIQIGVVLSALLFMKRMADNSEVILADADSEILDNYGAVSKNIEIYEISGPFFFGAAKHYAEMLKSHSSLTSVIIIRMRHVPFIDATGIHNFDAVIRQLQSANLKIILSGVQPSVRKELDKARISFLLGKANIFDSFNDALKHAENLIITTKE
ncbi:MAG: SulP family inorganic anion transporter [Bacteroidales bacterium]|nr:SulP family inorganic anion transporter [Bacteroidales bacterium]